MEDALAALLSAADMAAPDSSVTVERAPDDPTPVDSSSSGGAEAATEAGNSGGGAAAAPASKPGLETAIRALLSAGSLLARAGELFCYDSLFRYVRHL